MRNTMQGNGKMATVWLGIAIGAAVGIGYAVSRRRRNERWTSRARHIGKRVSGHTSDLAARGRDILDRAQHIYTEGRKIMEDAADLFTEGRRLVRT